MFIWITSDKLQYQCSPLSQANCNAGHQGTMLKTIYISNSMFLMYKFQFTINVCLSAIFNTYFPSLWLISRHRSAKLDTLSTCSPPNSLGSWFSLLSRIDLKPQPCIDLPYLSRSNTFPPLVSEIFAKQINLHSYF